jgi:flavin-dependent dehydrogenase
MGLRYYSPSRTIAISPRVELGTSVFPPVPSFPLDRGRLENRCWTMARARVRRSSTAVRCVRSIWGLEHRVVVDTAEGARTVTARWIVDSSGRAGLLKRKLG